MIFFRKSTLPMFLALRYLTWPENSSFTKLAMRICVFAVAIGAAALLTTLMITNGTKNAIEDKIKALTSEAVFQKSSGEKIALADLLSEFVVPEALESQVIVCPGTIASVVVAGQDGCFFNVFLRGVDWKVVDKVLDINQFFEHPLDYSSVLASGKVIVGSKLVQALGELGEESLFEISVPEFRSKRSVKLRGTNLNIGGVFDTGLSEFDGAVIFCSLEKFWSIYTSSQGQVDHLIVKVLGVPEEPLAVLDKANPEFKKTHWREMYKSLLSCMELEKNIMLLLIFFIALIAMINLSSLLVLQIQAKKRDITLLRVFGLGSRGIKSIFFILAMILVAFGTSIGMAFSLITALFFSHYWQIRLPEEYFIDRIFFDIKGQYFLIVFLLMIFCAILASVIPTAWVLKSEVGQGLGED